MENIEIIETDIKETDKVDISLSKTANNDIVLTESITKEIDVDVEKYEWIRSSNAGEPELTTDDSANELPIFANDENKKIHREIKISEKKLEKIKVEIKDHVSRVQVET